MRTEYIFNKAEETIRLSGGRNPYYAASVFGASVNFKDIGSLNGAYFGTMPKPAIVINNSLNDIMQQIVCAHELGHHLLHGGSTQSCESGSFNKTSAGIYEREANLFAATFLIDKQAVLNLLTQGYSIAQAASMLETDIDLVSFLLSALNLCEVPDSTFLKNKGEQTWQYD